MAAVDTTSDRRPIERPAHDGAEQTTGSPRPSSGDLAMTARLRGRRTRDPVVVSIGGATVLAVVLVTLAVNAPLEGNVDHAVGHLSLAVPILLLLAAVSFTWPPLTPGRPAHWIRMFLIMSLGLFGGGLLLEAVGAFGYPDTAIQINSLEWAMTSVLRPGPAGSSSRSRQASCRSRSSSLRAGVRLRPGS